MSGTALQKEAQVMFREHMLAALAEEPEIAEKRMFEFLSQSD